MELAWFRRDGGTFHPLPLAQSMWSTQQLHGVAISGLLARAMEETVLGLGAGADWVAARYHVDLFRPAAMAPTTAAATVVRQGNRLILVDAVVEQGETRVARASAIFLRPSANPRGEIWTASDRSAPPPVEIAPLTDQHHVPFFASDKPWSNNFREHQNGGRHQTWQVAMPIVLDEPMTPFRAVASIADNTSLVTNWGTDGVEYINSDISLALARRPAGLAIGLRALDHMAADGIAVGTAEIFDRVGPLGTATVTCLANARRTVDFSESQYDGTAGPTSV